MDATCAIQASIHVFSLVRKYVSRILGTYHHLWGFLFLLKLLTSFFKDIISYAFSNRSMCFTQYSYFPLITAREITIFWTSEVPS